MANERRETTGGDTATGCADDALPGTPDQWRPALPARDLIRIERTSVGPQLWIGDVMVRWWFGCMYDEEADIMAVQIKRALAP